MSILDDKSINIEALYNELIRRRGAPWNNGRINDCLPCPELNKLFGFINSGVEKEPFFYQGDLFRTHQKNVILFSDINSTQEVLYGPVASDGSCHVLPITQYTEEVVAYSMSPDFSRSVYDKIKIQKDKRSIFIHINTKNKYGIYSNELIKILGGEQDRFYEEYEVLFPLLKENIIKEYKTTPNKFKYYMRGIK